MGTRFGFGGWGVLEVLVIGLPLLGSAVALRVSVHRSAACALGVGVTVVQAFLVLGLSQLVQMPPVGMTRELSGLSAALLLAIYLGLALQFLYAKDSFQGEAFYSVALVLDALLTGAMVLSGQLPVAGLLLAIGLVVTVYGVAGRLKELQDLEAVLKMLIASALAAVAFLVSVLLVDTYGSGHDPGTIRIVAAVMSIGVGVLVGVFPFQLWLPKLSEVAPPMVSAWIVSYVGASALAAAIASAEVYPWLYSSERTGELWRAVGAIGAVVAAYLALTTNKLSRLVIYSSASNFAVAIVGLASVSVIGLTGAAYLLLSHLLAVLLLFMVLGLADYSLWGADHQGLGGQSLRAVGLLVGGLTLSGAPPLGGFAGRWLIYQALAGQSLAIVVGLLLAGSLVFLAFLRALLWGGWPEPASSAARPSLATISIVLTIIALLVLGLYPTHILALIGDTISGFPSIN